MAEKMSPNSFKVRFRIELKFMSNTNTHDWNNMTNVRLMSRHHKRIVDWKKGNRNKYASNRWINDSRGCGWGCIVAKKRFIY